MGQNGKIKSTIHRKKFVRIYLRIELKNFMKEILYAVFALACVQQYELDVASCQESGNLLVVDLSVQHMVS